MLKGNHHKHGPYLRQIFKDYFELVKLVTQHLPLRSMLGNSKKEVLAGEQDIMDFLTKLGEKKVTQFKTRFELTESDLELLIKLNYRYHTKISILNLLD